MSNTTTENAPAERPHEFKAHGEIENFCAEVLPYESPSQNWSYCGQPRDATVHQVAIAVEDCACHEGASCTLAECGIGMYHHAGCRPAPAEVHQTPEPEKPCSECGEYSFHRLICSLDRSSKGIGDLTPVRASDTPPDQHVAPPRIFIAPIGLKVRSNATIYTAEQSEPSDIEYLAAAPIQAALEKCEANMIKVNDGHDGYDVLKEDFDALVVLIKGEK